jgi:hypothetical protein
MLGIIWKSKSADPIEGGHLFRDMPFLAWQEEQCLFYLFRASEQNGVGLYMV